MSNNAAAAVGIGALLAAAIALLRKRKKATGDYLASLEKVGRWAELRQGLALTVAIDSQFSDKQVNDIKSAAEAWSKASGGRVTWHWLPGGSPANITISPGALGSGVGGWTRSERDTGDDAKEGVMLSAHIYLDLAQIRDFKSVVAHEIGHSCGLIDHAPDSVDSCLHAGGAGTPREADGKTLRRLYGW